MIDKYKYIERFLYDEEKMMMMKKQRYREEDGGAEEKCMEDNREEVEEEERRKIDHTMQYQKDSVLNQGSKTHNVKEEEGNHIYIKGEENLNIQNKKRNTNQWKKKNTTQQNVNPKKKK